MIKLEQEYEKLLAKEKAIKEKKDAILEKASEIMTKKRTNELGKFQKQDRTTYSWSLESLKELRPKNWQAFVKPDAGLLKEEMKSDASVKEAANKDVKTVVTFVR